MASPSEQLKPKPIRLRMPLAGLAGWRDLAGVLLDLYSKIRQRIQFDGAESIEQTEGGLRVKYRGGSSSGGSSGSNGPWTAPEGLPCGLCPDQTYLQVRSASYCGRAVCCGDLMTGEGDPPFTYAARVVTTQSCTLWDYTDGPLETSSCTRKIYQDKNVNGGGTATSSCETDPQCGAIHNDVDEGCGEGVPECAGIPAPGFKCYVVNSESKAYSKTCAASSLDDAAYSGRVLGTFTAFAPATVADFEGVVCGRGDDSVFGRRFDLVRKKGFMPIHLVLELREENLGGGGTVVDSESVVTIPSGTVIVIFTFTNDTPGRQTTIMAANIIYGQLPD